LRVATSTRLARRQGTSVLIFLDDAQQRAVGAGCPHKRVQARSARHGCIAVAGPQIRSLTIETGQPAREANMSRLTKEAIALLETVLRSG
jgi:hypothetical protein